MSMRCAPCCMVRLISAPSIFSNHCAVASGSGVRMWTWSQVNLAMTFLRYVGGTLGQAGGGRQVPKAMLTKAARQAFRRGHAPYDFTPFLCAGAGTGAAADAAVGVPHCASLEPSPQLRGR